jgi:hypothetical protein
MEYKKQFSEGFEPLSETQLLKEFKVEELEKRYEFSWYANDLNNPVPTNPYA